MTRYAEQVLETRVEELVDVAFQAPVKFFGFEPIEIQVQAEELSEQSARIVLSSSRTLKSGRIQNKVHFSLTARTGGLRRFLVTQLDKHRAFDFSK